jgi:hypothetical protein
MLDLFKCPCGASHVSTYSGDVQMRLEDGQYVPIQTVPPMAVVTGSRLSNTDFCLWGVAMQKRRHRRYQFGVGIRTSSMTITSHGRVVRVSVSPRSSSNASRNAAANCGLRDITCGIAKSHE